ncbi:hypothetical protein AVEN_12290-1 [Araneus ventricosus]|uniref:ATP-dependent DNA helicase n=1 Tax=Araneus ventricosus TaxID=182803 RepID=A0A4Y2EAH1_ARAVE|nr:hypothetical protein AVEN_12290-1 [Araneus ventricosus]
MLPDICYPSEQNPVKQLYGDLNLSTIMPEELKGRAILAVTNDASIDINNQALACLPGETVVDDIVSDDPNDRLTFPVEFLNLTPTGMPPYKLNLKSRMHYNVIVKFSSNKKFVHWNSLNCNQITTQHYRGKTHWFCKW